MLPTGDFGNQHSNWDDWNLDNEGRLVDPAGNKYLPRDIVAAFYGKQLYKSLAGTPFQISCLKQSLEQKLKDVPTTTIQITWSTQGGEEKKKSVELS